ncbi:YfjI family protein [Solitalea sp. MAHUQ-68]|uniref:YfjI family protein n=1 Tax=Solitalea agri TaxID=2953739 RepID=A0A9X2EZM8_9SPHI|nr:YfjI family protein [Solitalea agri]MCO4291349.1 YfjI family protein [Solitalea agri]
MNKHNPQFDFAGFGIDSDALKSEDEQLINQFKDAEKERENIFPVNVFPLPIQQIILSTNESLSFPIDFIGASLLFASSVAIGNTHKVEIKNGFQESAVLYLAIVARAGTNKSHPLTFALNPLVEQDKISYRQYEQERLDYEQVVNLSKKEKEKQAIDGPIKPVWRKFLLSDFTPEALAEVHKFNKRGIGVYVDELAGWFKNFNRYNKGSEMEFWLSAWNSKPINIDRKTGEPVFIPLPFISVAGTIQNGLLNELAKNSRTQNGFIDRILFVIPDNIQKPYWSETELNPIIEKNWKAIISSLMNLPINLDETFSPIPEVLRFTPQAKELLFDWQRNNADQCNDAEFEAISGIYSKLEMYVVRLALILEMMRWACNEGDKQFVGIESMQGAIQLIEYFKKSAVKAYSIISNINPLDKFSSDKHALFNALPDTFKTEEGLKLAINMGIPERTFKRFLNEQELFNRRSRGEYEKII